MEELSLEPCRACGGTLTVKEATDDYVFGRCENEGCSKTHSLALAQGFLSGLAEQGRAPTFKVAATEPFEDGHWVHVGSRSL